MKFNVKYAMIQELKEKIWTIMQSLYALKILFNAKNVEKILRGKTKMDTTAQFI